MKRHTQLVLEIDGRQAAHGLGHQASLRAHGGIAHFAFELLFRNQSRDGVYDDDVNGARADEGLGDVQGVVAAVGLADHEAYRDPLPGCARSADRARARRQ